MFCRVQQDVPMVTAAMGPSQRSVAVIFISRSPTWNRRDHVACARVAASGLCWLSPESSKAAAAVRALTAQKNGPGQASPTQCLLRGRVGHHVGEALEEGDSTMSMKITPGK